MPAHALSDPYEHGLKLLQAGRHVEAIAAFESALGARPGDPRVLFALGNTARVLGLAAPAEDFFRKVLAREPARLEALVALANLLRAEGRPEAAEALLAPALARDPDAPELWLTLGSTYREMGDAVRAAEHYRAALALRPDYAAALANLADLTTDDGATGEALALYDRALRLEPGNAQARLNRAVLHLLRGNLTDGWRDYAARLKLSGKAPVPEHTLKRWTGDSLKRTRLLVTAEQGVGDQLMFASMIPELAARAAQDGGTLLVECEPRLAALFARSFAGVTVHGWDLETRGGITRARYGWLKQAGGANAFIEMGSLPKILRANSDAFPRSHVFLKPDALELACWGGVLAGAGKGPFIGVCWRSGNVAGHRAVQYAPRQAWAAFIAKLPGTVVSVQYDAGADEIEALAEASGRPIVTLPQLDQKAELDRTAALLASLDAVVSAPTAVSWLAAGSGVDTYKVLYDTSWTGFAQSYEPFAPACELMMPARRGDWADTFARTLARLTERL
ncbi:MAG TPA: tetratricopeptide repeat protein [Rhizomicrobium sp.]|jgi:tetratricopeptide (TPR) repeat protein|nr:tetratricopeptide repeat protein [Rhizomicrobium sp.]